MGEIVNNGGYVILVKFMLSKKATKIFTIDLTLTTQRQINGEDFAKFVAFLENMNFTK